MNKTFSRPRITIDHFRAGTPSRAKMTATPDWLKGDILITCDMTEDELYELAEQALHIAGILRGTRKRA